MRPGPIVVNVDSNTEPAGDVGPLLASFVRHLRAERRSEDTITSYAAAVRVLIAFLGARGMPVLVAGVSREHVEEWLIWLHAGYKPATVKTRFGGVRAFFLWLVEEGELTASPVARIRAPDVPLDPPDVLTEEELARLLKACAGPTFNDRRDEAVVRLMAETGLRRAETAGLLLADVDLDAGTALVMGKGRRPRAVPFGPRTARAIDRYVRLRRQHRHAASPRLLLGQQGALGGAGIAQALHLRAEAAGITGFHLHRLRHRFADRWLAAGGQEGDLMRIAGWRSREMLARYGAARADARAHEAARRLALGEDV